MFDGEKSKQLQAGWTPAAAIKGGLPALAGNSARWLAWLSLIATGRLLMGFRAWVILVGPFVLPRGLQIIGKLIGIHSTAEYLISLNHYLKEGRIISAVFDKAQSEAIVIERRNVEELSVVIPDHGMRGQ
jgi:hypothetical protein